MTDRKKQEIRFALIPTIEIIEEEESRSFWSRSPSQVEQPVITQEKPLPVVSKILPYPPPDTLMYPLFSAIQRKAWVQARRLCHELILCDPERTSSLDLYVRLQQIIDLNDRQLHPQSAISQVPIADNDGNILSRQRSE